MQKWEGWAAVDSPVLEHALRFDSRRGAERKVQRDLQLDQTMLAQWNLPVETNSFVARVGSMLALQVLQEARGANVEHLVEDCFFESALVYWGRCMEKCVRIQGGDGTQAEQRYRALWQMWKCKNEGKETMPVGVHKWGLTYSPAPEQSAIALKFLSEWHTPVLAEDNNNQIDVAYMLYVILPLVCFQIAVKNEGMPHDENLSTTMYTVCFEHQTVWKWMQSIPEEWREEHSETNVVMPAETPLRHFLKASDTMITKAHDYAVNRMTLLSKYKTERELKRYVSQQTFMPFLIYDKMTHIVSEIERMALHLLRRDLQVVKVMDLISDVAVKAFPSTATERWKAVVCNEIYLGVQILLRLQYETGCFKVHFDPKYKKDEAALRYQIKHDRDKQRSPCSCPHCLAFGENLFLEDSMAAFGGRMVTAAAVWVIRVRVEMNRRFARDADAMKSSHDLLETARKLPGVKLSLSFGAPCGFVMGEKEQEALVWLLMRQTRAAWRIVRASRKWLQATTPQKRVTEEWKARLKQASRLMSPISQETQNGGEHELTDLAQWPLYQDFMGPMTPIKKQSTQLEKRSVHATPDAGMVTPATEPMTKRKRVSASDFESVDSSVESSGGA